jgi:hypothetical protein
MVRQYSETNVMHFLFSLLRINGLLHVSSITCLSSGGAAQAAFGIVRTLYQLAAPGLKWNFNPGAAN